MERHYDLIIRRVLMVITLILIAVALFGCNDPVSSNMDAKHQRLCNVARQEFQRNGHTAPASPQNDALFPAP